MNTVNEGKPTNFFTKAGLFLRENFFSPELYTEILAEARSNVKERAKVSRSSITLLDYGFRKTNRVCLPESTIALIESQVLSLQATLESWFNIKLRGCQPPQVLSYEVGDFFGIHVDNAGRNPNPAECLKQRLISVVIFLNNQVKEPQADSYMGGALTFYKLIQGDPRWDNIGFPVIGKANSLVAFPSGYLHEVKPVTYGERYTIVTWFV